MNDEQNYKNLVKLLILFQNTPNFLAKFLIDKCAFNDFFFKSLANSDKLNELDMTNPTNFKDISEMTEYFDIFNESIKLNKNDIKIYADLKEKLEKYLEEEKYEEAAKLRDYLQKFKNE